MTLASRIAVLKDGRLVQFDEPRTIYRRPASRFVAEFVGRPAMNTLDGMVQGGVFRVGAIACAVDRPDGPLTLGIRPEQIEFASPSDVDGIDLTVDVKEPIEPDTLLIFQIAGGSPITLRTQANCDAIRPGQPVRLRFPKEALHYFDAATGARLG